MGFIKDIKSLIINMTELSNKVDNIGNELVSMRKLIPTHNEHNSTIHIPDNKSLDYIMNNINMKSNNLVFDLNYIINSSVENLLTVVDVSMNRVDKAVIGKASHSLMVCKEIFRFIVIGENRSNVGIIRSIVIVDDNKMYNKKRSNFDIDKSFKQNDFMIIDSSKLNTFKNIGAVIINIISDDRIDIMCDDTVHNINLNGKPLVSVIDTIVYFTLNHIDIDLMNK